MKHSDSLTNIGAALVKTQASVKVALKEATNPHLKTKYADLGSVWDACRKALTENQLSVVQLPVSDEPGFIALETMILHASGEYISAVARVRLQKDDPQGAGSGLTYLRRYALSAALGVVADEDDDGHDASQPQGRTAQVRQPEGAPKPTGAKASGVVVALNRELQDNWEFSSSEREKCLSFINWLAGTSGLRSSKQLSDRQAGAALTRLKTCKDKNSRSNLIAEWGAAQSLSEGSAA